MLRYCTMHEVACVPHMPHRLSSNNHLISGQVPLGGELHRVGYDIFDVVVAPLSFFDLWVQPHVRCRVRCARQTHLLGCFHARLTSLFSCLSALQSFLMFVDHGKWWGAGS